MYLFAASFHIARNPLKLAMLTLFVTKNVPVFFHKRGNKASNRFMKVHPSLQLWEGLKHTVTHSVSVHKDGNLTQKESACLISVDSEQLENSQQNRYIRLPFHGARQIDWMFTNDWIGPLTMGLTGHRPQGRALTIWWPWWATSTQSGPVPLPAPNTHSHTLGSWNTTAQQMPSAHLGNSVLY